jgi:CheY-like chemotaxis protein
MPSVLIVENNPELSELLRAFLTEEGYHVSTLADTNAETVQLAVEQLEPDCVILDGSGLLDYGESWDTAAWLHHRARAVPTIMVTGHAQAVMEARARATPRSVAAAFVSNLSKPFDLDELLIAVTRATAA